jgi:hypothetical protein
MLNIFFRDSLVLVTIAGLLIHVLQQNQRILKGLQLFLALNDFSRQLISLSLLLLFLLSCLNYIVSLRMLSITFTVGSMVL